MNPSTCIIKWVTFIVKLVSRGRTAKNFRVALDKIQRGTFLISTFSNHHPDIIDTYSEGVAHLVFGTAFFELLLFSNTTMKLSHSSRIIDLWIFNQKAKITYETGC